MLATGGSAVVAKQMGEGKLDKARQNFSLIAVWGVGLGIVIGLLGVLCTDFFVTILGANAATYGYCYDYLFYMSLFTPFCILQLFFQFFFVTAGKPNLGLASTVAGGVANMVLDYVLIVPGDLGIAGAAIATGIRLVHPCGGRHRLFYGKAQ